MKMKDGVVQKNEKKRVRYVGDQSLRMTDWKKPLSGEKKKTIEGESG